MRFKGIFKVLRLGIHKYSIRLDLDFKKPDIFHRTFAIYLRAAWIALGPSWVGRKEGE